MERFTTGPPQAGLGEGAAARAAPAGESLYSALEGRFLLHLARYALWCLANRENPVLPRNLPEHLLEPRACFVTLRKNGRLRGCIGNIFPRAPLAQAVLDNTCGAALRDSRFPPLEGDEVPITHIELSILTLPTPLSATTAEGILRSLAPGLDGVVLKVGDRVSTFLPKVWEQIPDRATFLAQLCGKAGLDSRAWQSPTATLSVYRAVVFAEE